MNTEGKALALSAGGARGAYQAGALLALAESNHRFDRIAGTSIGSLNGAFYAQGDGGAEHAEGLCRLWKSLSQIPLLQPDYNNLLKAAKYLFTKGLPTFQGVLKTLTGGKVALLDPEPVAAVLDEILDYEAIVRSETELIIALLREVDPLLDLVISPWRTAKYVSAAGLTPKQLRAALLASVSIPLVFPTQKVDGRKYGDAGLAAPVPVEVLYRGGARTIYSVILSGNFILNRADFPGAAIVQIRPSMYENGGGFSTFDFSAAAIDRLLAMGYEDARAVGAEIAEATNLMASMREGGDANIALAEALPMRSGNFPEAQPLKLQERQRKRLTPPLEQIESGKGKM